MAIARKHWTDENIRALAREEVREFESKVARELDQLRGRIDAAHHAIASRATVSPIVRVPWWRRIFNRKPSHASQ